MTCKNRSHKAELARVSTLRCHVSGRNVATAFAGAQSPWLELAILGKLLWRERKT